MSNNLFFVAGKTVLGIVILMLWSSPSRAELTKLLLIGQGPDGHPRSTHEFMAGIRILEKCLAPIGGIQVSTAQADEPWPEGPKLIGQADGVVMFLTQGSRWMQNDPRRYDALTRLATRGGAIVALHWAVGAQDGKYVEGQLKLLGGSRGGPKRKYTTLTADVKIADAKHPITLGIRPFRVRDEFYYRLNFVDATPGIRPVLKVNIDGNDETVCWSWQRPDGGRSFGFVGLHFHKNWQLSEYRRLVTQGIVWSLKQEIPSKGLTVDVSKEDLQLKPITIK